MAVLGNFKNLSGVRFGKWTVIEPTRIYHSGRNYLRWKCRCDCGNERVVSKAHLEKGLSTSCRCSHSTQGRLVNRFKSEYDAWKDAKKRCYDPNANGYAYYGGRGISMCSRWLGSFQNFFSDMGPKPSRAHSLDRKNPNGNYEPENCRWVTRLIQGQNTRSAVVVSAGGHSKCLREWTRYLGIKIWYFDYRRKTMTDEQLSAHIESLILKLENP